ncbi:hypothetical protein V6N11_032541 [Hibiscus sabdariffa]|uniref:Uncharacterized protein n=1 Tax=Hibiscus sabdariffa TaxID=183260 RepID=A0ABR2T155_9ROSI
MINVHATKSHLTYEIHHEALVLNSLLNPIIVNHEWMVEDRTMQMIFSRKEHRFIGIEAVRTFLLPEEATVPFTSLTYIIGLGKAYTNRLEHMLKMLTKHAN